MEAGPMTLKTVCQVTDSETICPRCLARVARYLDGQPEYRTDRTSLASLKKKNRRLSYRIRAKEPVDFPNVIDRDYAWQERKQSEDQHRWNESQGFASDIMSDSRFGPLDYRAYLLYTRYEFGTLNGCLDKSISQPRWPPWLLYTLS